MDKQQAYYTLWSQFGIPAYDELSVPDNATMPYITYQVIVDELDSMVAPTASVWYRGGSWEAIDTKLAEITNKVGNMLPIRLNNGFMYVNKGTPWAQRMAEEADRNVRRYILNLNVEFLTQD